MKNFDPNTMRPRDNSVIRSVVSLFSGCGGLDLGFCGGFRFLGRDYERLPFSVVWASDLNVAACETYQHNLKHPIICGDIWEQLDKLPVHADVVIGGFPCQDVSVNGKGQAENGERTILYKAMIEAIRRLRPVAFVAENVKGLVSRKTFHQRLTEDFHALEDYKISQRVYMAANYGVPQKRERLFIVGMRGKKPFEHPAPSSPEWVTAGEALRDLESRSEDPKFSHIWSKAAASPDQGSRRLKKDAPATTIRAEHHGNTQWHYSLERRISLREAARLQSFPDDFVFSSGMRETERQIGNAVPPVLAWHIASALRDQIT
uniref:DNA (cytosine-5-)-methyltransferase n=1 Tax=Candidatus Kentrum sp. TC TaxID=2126339 RepID=A0A450YNG8_9GAMM|nr:MAG: DNA (cytosine-5)-methyltransferase 1 [Candidatus Kentron sp. TC]